jgi:DNA repair protein SbcD/Mre11
MAVSIASSALPARSFRLLHASDLHLERVPSGLREIPEHLRARLVDTSYTAARRLFATAITEQADAVLLAGDVVDLALAGPRAVVFLREQFELLAAEGIEVYWAGGRTDPPQTWPCVSPLPGNVHVFPAEQVRHFDLHQDGETVARIAGISSNGNARPSLAQFAPHPDGLLTIGVTYGRYSQADLAEQLVPYLAVGGRHGRKSFASNDRSRTLHYPGTTQGMSPKETGPHGCTLITIQSDGTLKTHSVATDAFRWELERVEVQDAMEPSELEQRLFAAAERLHAAAGTGDTFVRWQVDGMGPALERLRPAAARRKLIDRLRDPFGHTEPCLWSVDVDVPHGGPAKSEWLDEETILGDVLREIEALQAEPASTLELATYVFAGDRNSPLAERLLHLSPSDQQQILDATREECVALLSGGGDEAIRSPLSAQAD